MSVSIITYGGNGNGTTDNTSALNAALAALPAAGGQIDFPAGKYLFNSPITFNLAPSQSVSLVGDGIDATILYWPNSNGIQFNYTNNSIKLQCSVHVRDLTFTTSGQNVGTALALVNSTGAAPASGSAAQNDITRVAFRGDDGYVETEYWYQGLEINGVSNVNIIDSAFMGPGAIGGVGVTISGTASNIPVAINVSICTFNALSLGINIGAYTQGLTVSQCNFTTINYGVSTQNSVTGLLEIAIVESSFGCQIAAVDYNSVCVAALFSSNTFLINRNTYGIQLVVCQGATITGNVFASGTSTGGIGVNIGSTNANEGAIIVGNLFSGLGTGIGLSSGASYNNIQSNLYQSTTTNVSNSGSHNTVGGGSA